MNKEPNDNKSVDQSRRRLTQMAWTTPVIAAITLPAHAQTSATTAAPTTTTTMAPLPTEFRGNVPVTIQFNGAQATGDMCISSNGTSFDLRLLVPDGMGEAGYFEASGAIGSSITLNDVYNCAPGSETVQVSSISASGASFSISGGISASGTLPPGSGCPSDPGPQTC